MSSKDMDEKLVTSNDSIEAANGQASIDQQAEEFEKVSDDVSEMDSLTFPEENILNEQINEATVKGADEELRKDSVVVEPEEENPVEAQTLVIEKTLDEEEKNKKNQPLLRSQSIVLGLVAIMILSLLVFIFSNLLNDSKDQLLRADQAVESLFMDEQHNYLNAEISESDFTQAKEAIEDLRTKNQAIYQERYTQAEAMFNAVKRLNDIFQTEELLVQGNLVLPTETLVVKSSVTSEVLSESRAQLESNLDALSTRALLNDIRFLYQFADEVVSYAQLGRTSINNLPSDVSNRAQLLDAINAIQTVELQLTDYSKQILVIELKDELQLYANKIGDMIVAGSELGEYDPGFWDEVYWTDTLVYYFQGPPITEVPLISLTFDDGPNEEFTPQLLDILAKHDVKATFFVVGAYVDEFPDVARRIVNEGHIIANHTYNHPDLSTESDEEVLKQIRWTQESIEDTTGVWPTLYRLPFGAGGKRVIDLVDDMTSILWNIDSMDWHYHDAELTYDNIMANLQSNSLLLMHDTHQATPDVIDRLIPVLKEMNYEFVSPNEVGFNLRYYGD